MALVPPVRECSMCAHGTKKKKALPMPQTPPSVPASTRRSWPPRLGARRVGSVPPSMRKVPSLAIRGKGVLCPIRVAWGSLPRGPPTRPAARPDRPMRVASPRASVLLSLVNRGPRLLAPSPRGITRGRAVVVTPVSLEATGLLPWCGEGEGGPCVHARVPRCPASPRAAAGRGPAGERYGGGGLPGPTRRPLGPAVPARRERPLPRVPVIAVPAARTCRCASTRACRSCLCRRWRAASSSSTRQRSHVWGSSVTFPSTGPGCSGSGGTD